MAITSVTKDGGYLVIVEDGVTTRRSIIYEDTVVSEPPTDYEEVGNIYINSSGNLVVNYNGSSIEIQTDDLTGAEIVALLEALDAGSRLSHAKLDDVDDDLHTSIMTAAGDLITRGSGVTGPERLAAPGAAFPNYYLRGAATVSWLQIPSSDLPSDAVLEADVDDTPVNGATTDPISSNWAFDHKADVDAHHSQAHKDTHDPEDGSDALDTATPNIIQPDHNAHVGVAHSLARSDHVHGIVAGAPTGAVAESASAAEGTGTSFVRIDHVHTCPATWAPTAHKDSHDPENGSDPLDAAAPVQVAAANAEGSAHSFARSDHVHQGFDQGARVYHSADQTTTHNSTFTLAFDSERYDTDVIHDNSTNNSRLTCKTAGKYIITGTVMFYANSAGNRWAILTVGGSIEIATNRARATDSGAHGLTIAAIYDLAVNEYVEFQVLQSSGGDLDVYALANKSAEFTMQRIG